MTNKLSTRIMAAGLVDEGIAAEDLEEELAELKAVVASGKPVCPICRCVMKPEHYSGYYDSFSYWLCNCVEFPDAGTVKGGYA